MSLFLSASLLASFSNTTRKRVKSEHSTFSSKEIKIFVVTIVEEKPF